MIVLCGLKWAGLQSLTDSGRSLPNARLGPGGHGRFAPPQTKKADVVEHPEVFDHVGLLVNEPPGMAGLPFS